MPPDPATDVVAGPAGHADARGAYLAMQHVSEWVRFADTKAGLIAAAAAAVLALAGTRAGEIAMAIAGADGWSVFTGAAAIVAALAASLTFWSVVQALVPRPLGDKVAANRFAWPALAEMKDSALREHIAAGDAESDAWAQTKALADIAASKYEWCRRAMVALLFFILLTVVTVALASAAAT